VITVAQARRHYEGADAVHDFDHVLRVYALAKRVGKVEGADMEIIQAAALLHDVGREWAEAHGLDHAAFAANRAREILADRPHACNTGCVQHAAQVEAITHAIAAHRFRTRPDPATLEAQVLFDADKLDAIGAIGIARAFAYGGAHGQQLWAPVESIDLARWLTEGDNPQNHTPVHEFVVKLSRIKERLFTQTGRAIAEERHAYMVAFFNRLNDEVQGKR
jgi:uncharacterized protein